MSQRHVTDVLKLDDRIFDLFQQRFSVDELRQLAESTMDIQSYLEDDDAGEDLQKIFDELEVILPGYIEMVRKSFDECGDEMYFGVDEFQTLQLPITDAPRTPKLPINDEEGTMGFAFLQVAAYKAGMTDVHLRSWYLFTHMFLHSIIKELDSGMKYRN